MGTGESDLSRRGLMVGAAGILGAAVTSGALPEQALAQAKQEAKKSAPAPARTKRTGRPNILFVFSDQESYRAKWPSGVSLPGHDWLRKKGVTFHNHYCPATMCTSSRSVMMTGLTTVDNRMFENCDVRYVRSLSTKIPTIGHMLRKLDYYTAYKGKWHLSRDLSYAKKLVTA